MTDGPHIQTYYLPCVKCPFCKEIVEAQVIEENNIKKIICPACKKFAEYNIKNNS